MKPMIVAFITALGLAGPAVAQDTAQPPALSDIMDALNADDPAATTAYLRGCCGAGQQHRDRCLRWLGGLMM